MERKVKKKKLKLNMKTLKEKVNKVIMKVRNFRAQIWKESRMRILKEMKIKPWKLKENMKRVQKEKRVFIVQKWKESMRI
jgi:hypothetical protein